MPTLTLPTDGQLVAAVLRATDGLSLRDAGAEVGVSHQTIAVLRRTSPPWSLHAETREVFVSYLLGRGALPRPMPRDLSEKEEAEVRGKAATIAWQAGKADRWKLLKQVEALAAMLRGEV